MFNASKKFYYKIIKFMNFTQSYSYSKSLKLTFYSKAINDITILDSLFLKKTTLHPEYSYLNLASKPLFFLLYGNLEKDKLAIECNEDMKKIREDFAKLKTMKTEDSQLDEKLKQITAELFYNSENNILTKEIPEILKNYEEMNKYFEIFKEIKKKIFDLIKKFEQFEEIEKKNICFSNLAHIASLNIYLNILDLEIWQAIIKIMVYNFDMLEHNQAFSTITQNIIELFNFFRFRLNDTKIKTTAIFFYDEKEITSLLNKHLFIKIFENIEKSFKQAFEIQDFRKVDILSSNYNQICLMTKKYARIQSLDNHQILEFQHSLNNMMFDYIDKLSLKTCLIFYTNFANFGYDNHIMTKLEDNFIANLDSLNKEDERFVMSCLLTSWRSIGRTNNVLYTKYMKPKIVKNFSDISNKRFSTLTNLFYDFVCMNIFDEDILKKLLKHILKSDIEGLPLFNKKTLHNAFQSLLSSGKLNFDISPYVDIINKLSMFCIDVNYNKINKFHNIDQANKNPIYNQLKLIDCCNSFTREEIKKSMKSNLLENELKLMEQKGTQSIQEKMVIKSINENLIKKCTEKIAVCEDFQVCFYSIDLALFLENTKEKIAIEICGKAYGTENGNFLGKKKMKFKYLEMLEWKVVSIDISQKKLFNFLGSYNQHTSENISKEVQNKIEEKLGRKLKMQVKSVGFNFSQSKQFKNFKK